ncbi:MAG: hypothetical protein N3D10_03760 [Candidatus Micrarchaeota archaeon]|nr:hypothetical protein [Candidatus Micrarchaeota archaeon]
MLFNLNRLSKKVSEYTTNNSRFVEIYNSSPSFIRCSKSLSNKITNYAIKQILEFQNYKNKVENLSIQPASKEELNNLAQKVRGDPLLEKEFAKYVTKQSLFSIVEEWKSSLKTFLAEFYSQIFENPEKQKKGKFSAAIDFIVGLGLIGAASYFFNAFYLFFDPIILGLSAGSFLLGLTSLYNSFKDFVLFKKAKQIAENLMKN